MGFMDTLSDILLPEIGWQVFTPEVIVLLFALLAPIAALGSYDRKGIRQFALLGLGFAMFITLGTLLQWRLNLPGSVDLTLDYISAASADDYPMKGIFAVNAFTQLFKLIFLAVAFLAVLGTSRPLNRETDSDTAEFYSLLMFATLGMMIVASAQDLFLLFLGIEMASLSSYLLAGMRRDSVGAEAALKYFIIGAASSGMALFGISLLYGATGTTNLAAIGDALSTGGAFDAISFVAIVLFIGGLGFKISAAPFHLWAPDVYSGAPIPVAGMLSASSKAMGFAAVFSVFLVGLGGVQGNWQLVLAAVAVATMFVGNLVALQQQSIRRMLAYSSIAQAGYLLIAVVVGTTYALGGGILHLMVNAGMKLGAFLIVGALVYIGIPDTIDRYKGLARRAPFLAFAMIVFLLSMAGLPPLGGFTSKFVLFSGAIDTGINAGQGWLIWIAVFAVLNSAISLYYYLRVIRAMVVDDGDEGKLSVDSGVMAAVGACLAFVVLVGVYPQWFVELSMDAARAFFAP